MSSPVAQSWTRTLIKVGVLGIAYSADLFGLVFALVPGTFLWLLYT